MVECVVSRVASEILFILNGNSLASGIARGTLREAMLTDPDEVNNSVGFIQKALCFLAGYGIYICTSTGRIVGRMLDGPLPNP